MAYRARFALSAYTLLFTSSALALVAACSADGAGDGLLETDEAGTLPAPTSTTRLPPATPTDAAADDGGKDAGKDGAKDAAKESGVDAGPPVPSPGDACPTVDVLFKRMCGACGSQEALCLAKPDGTPGVVSDYSICTNELAGGCMPGATENEECGNCGTRKRTCNQYCAWTTGACTGEPANACAPTTQDYTNAGCPANVVRTRACTAACTWTSFSGTCDALQHQLVVASAAGGTVSAIYPLRATMADKRMTGTCPSPTLSTTTNHPFAYVELVNPTNDTLTLSAWNMAAPNGGPVLDTLMAWYAGSAVPARGDDVARKACTKGVNDSCPTGVVCGDYKWAGLTGAQAITIPPLGSAVVWFGTYYAAGGSSPTEGNVKLVVRTDALQ